MTSGYEPVLHALAVEPPVARPGDVVRLTFHTRNVGTLPSPAAAVAFELPDGLEAIEETEATLLPAAPGEPAVATIRARVMAPCDDRTELSLQAFLVLPERRLATCETGMAANAGIPALCRRRGLSRGGRSRRPNFEPAA